MGTEQAVRNGLAILAVSLRQEVDAIQRKAYVHGLRKVPGDVVNEAVDALIEQLAAQPIGKRFFPTVPDWLAACADVVKQRRALASRQAKAIQETCGVCNGIGWETVVIDQVERLKRCHCFTRGLELMAAAPQPIALPPTREDEKASA